MWLSSTYIKIIMTKLKKKNCNIIHTYKIILLKFIYSVCSCNETVHSFKTTKSKFFLKHGALIRVPKYLCRAYVDIEDFWSNHSNLHCRNQLLYQILSTNDSLLPVFPRFLIKKLKYNCIKNSLQKPVFMLNTLDQ